MGDTKCRELRCVKTQSTTSYRWKIVGASNRFNRYSICVTTFIPFAFHLVPGTKCPVPGTWYPVPGSGTSYLPPGTWYLVLGTRYQEPGWYVPGSWYLVQVPNYQVPVTWYMVPVARCLVPGAWCPRPQGEMMMMMMMRQRRAALHSLHTCLRYIKSTFSEQKG